MKKAYSSRQRVFILIFALISLIFAARLFYLQIIDDSWEISSNKNALRHKIQYPSRGLIYDRNGELLVYNEATYDLMVVPNQIKDLDTNELALLLDLSIEDVENRLLKARKYSSYAASAFEKQISKETYGVVEEKLYKFPGFYVQPRTLRYYPEPIAAHILGYIGEVNDKVLQEDPYYRLGDYIGISGMEKSYEEYLRGKKGVRVVMVDVHNREQGSFRNGEFDTVPIPGTNIWSSIDIPLQKYGEELLQNKKGSVVAIEPASGEILCLVSSPSYDPNLMVGRNRSSNYNMLLKDSINKPLFNRALMAMYPPGSTFKVANALIGLQEGILTPSTRLPCHGGFVFGNLRVGCHAHASPLDLSQSVQHSCNAYYCRAFKMMLDDRKKYKSTREAYNIWRDYLIKMGFGTTFDTDLPYELKGIVPTAEFYDRYHGKNRWKALSIISLAIGQGELGTTPLQLANFTAMIANKGYYIRPHMVKAIGHPDSLYTKYTEPVYTGIDEHHFESILTGMSNVVTAGTARRALIKDIPISGKTGTSQNPHGIDHALFIGFAPSDDPKIAIAVVIENAGFGGVWAAPIASLMIEMYMKREISRPELENSIKSLKLIR
ncbi:MAG: penicillin-binding protein 2 [Bacteroidales bacterium]|nr:penicillin-binding protein 2 [Bacteroidales bacterium]